MLGHKPEATDEAAFLRYANNLRHGLYAQPHSLDPTQYLWHGPGLPALLVPLVALNASLGLIRVLVGALLLFAAILAFQRLARRYVSQRTSLLASYGLALYLPFFRIDGVFVEPLATLCLTLVALFGVRSFRGGRRDHIWAAGAFAVLAMSRIEFGIVLEACVALSLIWLIAARGSMMARRSLTASLLALVLCAPWLIYTASLTHKPFYWGNSGGLSLYWMSAPGNLGDWHRESAAFAHPQLAASRTVFEQAGHLKPLAQDARLTHIAWENIKHDPGHYLSNVVNNLDRLVFNSPYSFTNQKASSMLYAVPNALLLGLLAVAGFVAVRVRRILAPEILPIALFALLGFAVHVPVAAYARFVTPLAPVAVWLVVAVLGRHAGITSRPAAA